MDKGSGAWVRLLLSTLTQEGCSRSAAIVLAVIADKATEREDKRAWMRQKEIAAAAGVDPRTVRRAVQQLRALGLIQTDQKGKGEPLCYQLTEAVELPVKRDVEARAAAARKRQRKAQQEAEEERRMNSYLELVNRFKCDEEKEDAS